MLQTCNHSKSGVLTFIVKKVVHSYKIEYTSCMRWCEGLKNDNNLRYFVGVLIFTEQNVVV